MTYTLIALLILTAVSTLAWGLTAIILTSIAVITAVSLDYLLSLVMKQKGPRNTLSAAVYGLIVAHSYALTVTDPSSWVFVIHLNPIRLPEILPTQAPMAYGFVAVIAAVGIVLFKKGQGCLAENT